MGIYCLQNKAVVSRVPGKVVMRKKYVKCTATLYNKDNQQITSQSAENGENDAGAQRIINSSEFYANLAGVTKQEPWGKFHCAEPNSLAKAIKERNEKRVFRWIKYAKISDGKLARQYVDPVTRRKEPVGTVIPRCRNCSQWVPGYEVTAKGQRDD